MPTTYWFNQTDKLLFPELLWSRPENKSHAGKLLIIGGNEYGFAAPAAAYSASQKAGIGAARVMLPDKLQKTVTRIFPEAEYAPSTPSGSFASRALSEILASTSWADGVLLSGGSGHNSETTILLESLTTKYQGLLVATGDVIEHITDTCIMRPNTLFVLDFRQIQKLSIALHSTTPITSKMSLLLFAETLHNLTKDSKLYIITILGEHIFVAVDGLVSSTKYLAKGVSQPSSVASQAAVWWIQNSAKPFEALTTAVYEAAKSQT